MAVYLFEGIPVSDFADALAWHERLFGGPEGNEIGFGNVPAELGPEVRP